MHERGTPRMLNTPSLVMVLLAVMLAAGCKGAPSMQAFNIDLNVSENVDRAFTVDLVGLASAADPVTRLEVRRYFAADSRHRSDLFEGPPHPVTRNVFANESGLIALMAADDARWSEWRNAGVMHVMVIVDRLGAASDADYQIGDTDTRRLVIPLANDRWKKKGNRITIEAMTTRLRYSPHPDPDS